MTLRPMLIAALLATGAPAFAQYSSGYDDQRAGYIHEEREIQSVLEFEAPLARYGSWVPSRFGRAWHPRVDSAWRPYTVGRWVEGEGGQAWQSDEPWGWATYHYGRWGFDDRWGWVWVPDVEWAPAWVAWRDGDEYAGWAPLPPRAGYGYDVDAWDYTQWYAPSWVYVPRASLYRRNVGSVALPWRGNRGFWDRTRGTRRDRDWSRDGRPGGYDRGPGRPRDGAQQPWQGRDVRIDRGRPQGDGQPPQRFGRRPGYVPLGNDGGQPRRPDVQNRAANDGPRGDGRGGRDRPGITAPNAVPPPRAAPLPRPVPPPVVTTSPPRQAPAARPAPPPRRYNPRLGQQEQNKSD